MMRKINIYATMQKRVSAQGARLYIEVHDIYARDYSRRIENDISRRRDAKVMLVKLKSPSASRMPWLKRRADSLLSYTARFSIWAPSTSRYRIARRICAGQEFHRVPPTALGRAGQRSTYAAFHASQSDTQCQPISNAGRRRA